MKKVLRAEDLNYRLAVLNDRGRRIYVDDLIEDLGWEEFDSQLAQRLTCRVKNEKLKDGRVAKLMSNGTPFMLFAGHSPRPPKVMEGRIFANETSWEDAERHQITGYDPLYYLMQSEDDRYYPAGKTGEAILKDLARSYGIPAKRIDGPNEKLGKLVFRGELVATMAEKVLRQTRAKGGGRWILQADEDGLANTVRRGRNRDVWYFERDNIQSHRISRSIEQLVTVVRVVGRNKGGSKTLARVTGATEFGRLQKIVNRSDYNTPGAAKKAAIQLIKEQGEELKERSFLAPDVPSLRRGHRIHVKAGTANGFYIVTSVSHDATAGMMSVTYEGLTDEEVAYTFTSFGLENWIPPEDIAAGDVFTGDPSKALAISAGVQRGADYVYKRAAIAAARAGGGFVISSWYRPGAKTSSGTTSYHATGRALDIVASPLSRLDALKRELKDLERSPTELLWRVEDHFDHLHVAWAS